MQETDGQFLLVRGLESLQRNGHETKGFNFVILYILYTVIVKFMLRPTINLPVSLRVKLHLGPKTRFLWLSDSYGSVDVRCLLCREDGYII
jgi:hypothetical protein